MSPASYLAAPPRVACTDSSTALPAVTIWSVWDWAIFGALIVGTLAALAAFGFLGVRLLQGWRALKRFRRRLGKELERLGDLGEATADKVAAASDTAEVEASLTRLRVTLARLAVLRAALGEAGGTFAPAAVFFARK